MKKYTITDNDAGFKHVLGYIEEDGTITDNDAGYKHVIGHIETDQTESGNSGDDVFLGLLLGGFFRIVFIWTAIAIWPVTIFACTIKFTEGILFIVINLFSCVVGSIKYGSTLISSICSFVLTYACVSVYDGHRPSFWGTLLLVFVSCAYQIGPAIIVRCVRNANQ